MPPQIFNHQELMNFRKEAELHEEKALSPYASFSKNHYRPFGEESDHRLPYKRDVDRIIHSKAYARYVDKTQVVYLVQNDHITHRGLHVQLVSNFSRGIAEILRLNLDLVEAIALGHDVGHPPFGHEGEGYLSELSLENKNGPFAHPFQSCRLFREIEPLNLGLAVYDGFLCHDGGMQSSRIEPNTGKTWEIHLEELKFKLSDPEYNIMPGTLEGCLVKLCDTMSYIGKDIEDAISLGIISREAVPKTHLGDTNREILSVLAQDILRHSYGRPYIEISQESFEALKTLRHFNFENIYHHPKLKVESKKIKNGYRLLFYALLDEYRQSSEESVLWRKFLSNKSLDYLEKSSPVQMVIDYIAGMTNSYFTRLLQSLVVPTKIDLER